MMFKLPMLSTALQTISRGFTELRRFNFIDGDKLVPKPWDLNLQIYPVGVTGSPVITFIQTQRAEYRYLGEKEIFFYIQCSCSVTGTAPGDEFFYLKADAPPGVVFTKTTIGSAFVFADNTTEDPGRWLTGPEFSGILFYRTADNFIFDTGIAIHAWGTILL